ncbi:hypothetical protein BU24DRAFT_272779 [Aaosphaeria arxii CBS 175.79]|uniref:Rhodopsin domain-containing protein n=1 Tax=Aaosphaeria arxii CBS 175.79 TaxID=1450172 RepID=A0A6A5XIU3_9PLEO|nr:uncharacterized protein BU24DRAFT_272779 [Aaosphaeria arxii CBS 175.79]KAF2012234.1 hypothetical protein BU24DRAFT_272779 [Aaosphaeria arxii CBS 175.79]
MGANSSVPAVYNAPAYGILSLDVVLTTSAVIGRLLSRRVMKARPSVDDYLAYLAYAANIGLLISGFLLTASGALDLEDISVQSQSEKDFTMPVYDALALLYVFSITFIKASILFLYRRTFTMLTAWFRWAWWAIFALVLMWTSTCIILLALQRTNRLPKGGFSRLGISVTAIVNAFTDFLVLGLPAVRITKMSLRRRQKIALISIFMIGGIASIVSVIRGTIFFINRANRLNEAYSNYLDIVLTATESSAGIMCACLPLMKPLVVRATRWLQRLRGLDTRHQGWTTASGSSGSGAIPSKVERDRSIRRVDDYDVQLLPVSPTSESTSVLSGKDTWQGIAVDPRDVQRPCKAHRCWSRGRL